jgi:hypothetical protein
VSDQEAPFASFVPSGEPPHTEPETKPRKKRKGKDKSTRPKEAAAAPKVRKTRKPRTMKIDLNKAFVAIVGLNEQEAQMLDKIAAFLTENPKKSRSKVLTALCKIFL